MAWIVICFVAGIGLGTQVGHKKRVMSFVSKFSEALVFVLLFALGAAIGSHAQIMSHIWSLGWEGLLLALGAIGGSLLASKPVERLVDGGDHEG